MKAACRRHACLWMKYSLFVIARIRYVDHRSVQRHPKRYDIEHRAHSIVHEPRGSGASSPNLGISSMCIFDSVSHRFLSGGMDGRVYLWSVSRSNGAYSASSRKLTVDHPYPIRCVAYNEPNSQLFACYNSYIHVADPEVSRATAPIFLSSKPQQIHIHPQNPAVVILEVSLRPAD